jgi:hypothetical protein
MQEMPASLAELAELIGLAPLGGSRLITAELAGLAPLGGSRLITAEMPQSLRSLRSLRSVRHLTGGARS